MGESVCHVAVSRLHTITQVKGDTSAFVEIWGLRSMLGFVTAKHLIVLAAIAIVP